MAEPTVPLDAIADPALLVDGGGSVLAANAAARQRWGGRPETLEAVFADADDAEAVRSAVGEGEWRGDCRLGDGRDRWTAAVAVRPAGADESLVTLRDVGDRHSDERRAAMLEALLGEVPVSVYFKDEESRHVRVSEHLAEDLRPNGEGAVYHTAEDVEGNTEFDLYPNEIAEPAVADDRRVMESGEAMEGRVERVERPSGEIVYITTAKAPWYDADGDLRGILGVSVETTAQKRQAEDLKRQNERLEQFASAVSHDLRNPLEVATANLQQFRESGEETHLDTVERMHRRMAHLIDDTLELARGGEPVTNPDSVDVATLAREAWNAVDTGNATLTVEWEGTVPADRSRLSRLFENCFRNAVEHGSTSNQQAGDAVEEGSASEQHADAAEHAGNDVTVRVRPLADGRAGFAIEDDGPGIPADERETVFDRGFTTSEEGTGFGLSIVGEIVDAHGWAVRVTESDAGGARFEFETDPEE